jgi:alpha-amylase
MLMSPKSTRLALGLLFVLFLAQPVLKSQDVILQGFYWNTNPGDISTNSGVWWDTIAGRAPYLADVGFKTVWTPPANKGFGNVYDMGYGVYDYYDFGEYNQKGSTRTRHGNKAQLQSMISALHGNGIKVMADLVLNHRGGGDALEPEDCDDGANPTDAWTDFNPASGRLPMDAADFHPNFTHCDVFAPYHDRLFFEDLCYFNFLDQTLDPPLNDWYFGPHNLGRAGDSLIVWGRYLLDVVGFDEVRLDAVKHIEPGFLAPFLVELAAPNQPFAVGELFDGNLGTLVNYRNEVKTFVSNYGIGSKNANLAIFDFNLRYALRDMCNGGGGFNMWNLNTSGLLFGGGLPGEDVVTFVENHDVDRIGWQVVSCASPHQQQVGSTCLALSTDSGHDPIISDKEDMGYPYIMAAEGRPTVFWKDLFWYGLKEDIEWQMAMRAATAKGGSGRIQDLNPFFTAGNGGDLFVMNRYGTTNGASDGLVLALNDNPSSESSVWVNTPFSNKYLKDYSDGYLFVTTQAFADGRANVKAQSRDYAWWSVTGLYPQLPGATGSNFQMDAEPGGCPHFIALRAADAANLLVNGSPIAAGDEVAVKNGAGDIVGIGRIGQGFQWDGVHDMIIEVLGAPSANGMGNGEQFSFVVYDASANAEVTIGYVQYATAGSGFTFSPDRPDSPNRNGNFSTFNLTATATGLYTCGGITRALAFGLPVVPLEDLCGAPSQANAVVYDNDGNQIQNGDNDGTRFLPWTGRNPASNNGNAGLFNGNSATNGDGDGNSDGDINTGGEAWGVYANSSNLSEAIRPFASPLAVGQTFSIKMDNGWIDGGSTVGLSLRNSSNNNVWEFFFIGGNTNYSIQGGGGQVASLVGFTDEGLLLEFTLITATVYSLKITELFNGNVTLYSGSLMNPAGGSTIDRVRLFNFNAGPDGQRNAFFNSMQICDPPALVINEVDYEQPGPDNGEFVELRNMNTTAINLDDFTLQLVNGSGDVVYDNFNLPIFNLAAGDYYVVCLGGYSGPQCDLSYAASIQNGAPDAVRLMWNGVRVDALSYEGDVPSAVEGTGNGLLDPDTTPGVGLSRVPNGSDTDQNNVDFELTCITPGAANAPDNTDTDNDGAPDGCDDCPLAQNQGSISNFNQANCDCDPGYYAVTAIINGQTVITGCNPCGVVSAGSNSPVCEGSTLNLNSSTGVSHSWSGPNGFTSSEQNPSIPGASLAAAGLYAVTVIDQNGCEGSATVNVVIDDLATAAISYDETLYCPNSGIVPVNLTGTSGGSFSAAPAGLSINPVTGAIDTDASTEGTYTVSYTIPPTAACPEVIATTTVAVLDNTPPAITCPSNIVQDNDPGACGATVSVPVPVATDNCLTSGYALRFGGMNEQVLVPDDASLDFGAGNFSFEVWIKTTAGGTKTLIDKRVMGGAYTGYTFFLSNGKPALQMSSTSFNNFVCHACSPVNDGTWHHLAFTVNRGMGELRVYVDGNFGGALNISGIVGSIDNSRPLQIGGHIDNSGAYYIGVMDDVRLWRKLLTPAEIQASMNTPLAGSESFLEGYWRFDEGTGTLAADSSPNGNDGALQNMESFDWTTSLFLAPLTALSNDFNNTGNASGFYPPGPTTVEWTATDASGNPNTCSMTVTVTDNQPPSITCPASTTVSPIPGSCEYTISGTAYDPSGISDNCGIGGAASYNVVSGSVSPASGTTLSGAVLAVGANIIEWSVSDVNNLTGTCQFTLTVSACTISGKLIWKGPPANTATGVANATVFLSGDDSDTFTPTLADGEYSFTGFTGSNFIVKPQKTSGMFNGVNVGDATAIQAHLTGPPYVTDFFRLVAADVNKSNTISTLDATIIKQALLGNPTANNILNNTKSWRFISSSFAYPDPAGPFNLPAGMPETRSVTGQSTGQDFFGIKVGDFLETANPALSPMQMEPLVWRTADRKLQAGEPLEVTFTASNFEDIAAYQFALDFDPGALEFQSLEVLTDLIPLTLEGNFGLFNIEAGELRALFSMLPGQALPAEHPVFRLNFTVLESGQLLSEVLQIGQDAIPALAFNTALDETVVELEFFQETTSVSVTPAGERRVVLLQNRPNPFDRETTIGFILPEACEAQLRVFDLNGREWWKTVKQYGAGYQEEIVRLEQAGTAGLLFCELTTPFGVVTGKMAMTGK